LQWETITKRTLKEERKYKLVITNSKKDLRRKRKMRLGPSHFPRSPPLSLEATSINQATEEGTTWDLASTGHRAKTVDPPLEEERLSENTSLRCEGPPGQEYQRCTVAAVMIFAYRSFEIDLRNCRYVGLAPSRPRAATTFDIYHP
jgi:hypothetical protein